VPLARFVGPQGRVIAVDLQEEMLAGVRRRAERAGVLARIHLHRAMPGQIGLDEVVDFALAFWMAHEVPGKEAFFWEIHALLKPAGQLLLVEPVIHVSAAAFERTVAIATAAGLRAATPVPIRISRAALLAHAGE